MSTKEDRIADIKDAILANSEDRMECIQEREEKEKKLFEFLSMIRKTVTEFGKDFYILGFTSGQRKEQCAQLNEEYKRLTGERLRLTGERTPSQNQFFVDREAPP